MNEKVYYSEKTRVLVRHGGTGTGYTYHGCRCEDCVRANTTKTKTDRKQRDPSTLPADKHGKRSTYVNWGCRCDACKQVHQNYEKLARARRKEKENGTV